jgi:putative spermidine/putrescine transport system substrate-binding protein
MISAGVEGAPYDIVMTDEIWASDLRHKGFYTSLPMDKVPMLKDLSPVARMQNDEGALFDIEPIGIAYRTDLIKTPPKSWKDLWSPQYKGKLGLYTITNTVGGIFLMLTSKIWGGDPKNVDVGFAKIKELKPFHQSDFSGNMEILLTQGEVPIGILETPAVARLRQKGVKVAYVIPTEGMMMFDEDISVTKASKNKDAAYAFVNYLLSPRVQEKFMRKFFSTSPNTKVVVPPELQKDIPISGERTKVILRWDYDWYNQNKGDFIKRWDREISG